MATLTGRSVILACDLAASLRLWYRGGRDAVRNRCV